MFPVSSPHVKPLCHSALGRALTGAACRAKAALQTTRLSLRPRLARPPGEHDGSRGHRGGEGSNVTTAFASRRFRLSTVVWSEHSAHPVDAPNASSKVLASWRSAVSNPSVNQP